MYYMSYLTAKFMGNLWSAEIDQSPLDVVAWHGNYAPYKYDLRRFNTIDQGLGKNLIAGRRHGLSCIKGKT